MKALAPVGLRRECAAPIARSKRGASYLRQRHPSAGEMISDFAKPATMITLRYAARAAACLDTFLFNRAPTDQHVSFEGLGLYELRLRVLGQRLALIPILSTTLVSADFAAEGWGLACR